MSVSVLRQMFEQMVEKKTLRPSTFGGQRGRAGIPCRHSRPT